MVQYAGGFELLRDTMLRNHGSWLKATAEFGRALVK